jgi:hypothetical protein
MNPRVLYVAILCNFYFHGMMLAIALSELPR